MKTLLIAALFVAGGTAYAQNNTPSTATHSTTSTDNPPMGTGQQTGANVTVPIGQTMGNHSTAPDTGYSTVAPQRLERPAPGNTMSKAERKEMRNKRRAARKEDRREEPTDNPQLTN